MCPGVLDPPHVCRSPLCSNLIRVAMIPLLSSGHSSGHDPEVPDFPIHRKDSNLEECGLYVVH